MRHRDLGVGQDHIRMTARVPVFPSDTGLACGVFSCRFALPDGTVWEGYAHNRIVTVALVYVSRAAIIGSTPPLTNWFLGLTAGSPSFVAGDTLASHAGWTEFTAYTATPGAGPRPNYLGGDLYAPSPGLVTNTASPCVYTLTSTGTVGGVFMASVASGATGTLWGGGAFDDGDANLPSGTRITVTYVTGWQDDGV